MNGGEKISTIDLKLHLKPWDKEDTKMQRMLSGNVAQNPVPSGNIDISINQNIAQEDQKDEEGNTFREHMSYRKKIQAMMTKNFL